MENLADKSLPELRSIAKSIGLVTTRETADNLRKRIILTMNPGLLDEMNQNGVDHTELKRAKAQTKPDLATVDELRNALTKMPKLTLKFYDEEGAETNGDDAVTWHVINKPAEDSGTMRMPLKIILRKATEINNARFPAKLGRDAGDLAGALGA
jgi:hypothetical protein